MRTLLLLCTVSHTAAWVAPHKLPAVRPTFIAKRSAPESSRMAVSAACGAVWVTGTVAVGALPAVFVVQNLEPWYASLKKPLWSPPNNIFAPVWSTLYALIGFSCARTLGNVWLGRAPQPALAVYLVQAVLNLSWAPIFFGAHRLRLGFFVSTALLASAAAMAVVFGGAAGAFSAWLLAPYLGWLTFATALNLRLWQLNGAHP